MPPVMDWRNRLVVITGASAGVGRALARDLARRGAALGLLARGVEGLDGARREAESLGARVVTVAADVADPAAVSAAAERIERELGPIDVWVNNAMASVFSPIDRMTPEEFARVTSVTYLGAVHGTLAALARMKPRNRGTIVQVGSALAFRGIPLQSAYCAAKHALQGFTESLRSELLHDGSHVHVTTVHLPALNTPQIDWTRTRMPCQPQPVPPIFQPELAADAIVWAVTHRRRDVLVGWPTVKAVFGNSLMPWLVDRYLARFGYDAQQTDEPVPPDRPDNLFSPVSGDHGAHGRFDARARSSSAEWWMLRHRGPAFASMFAIGAIALAVVRHRARAREAPAPT